MEFKAKKIIVPEENPFQNDKLDLKGNIENLSELLQNISTPIVFSINSPWGHGKTTFLEMLNSELKDKKCNTVFFSAWETDFADDPLLAFLGEINNQLSSLIGSDTRRQEAWEKAKRAGSHIIRKGIPALIKVGTAGVIDAEKIIEDEASKLTSEISKDLINEYQKNKNAIDDFKKNVSELLKDNNNEFNKLYVFIDELDRCRPTYAIELLERIKHLLEIDGIVFILAMDKEQLGHSIKGVYGQDFEANGYLKRFIDIEFSLPESDLDRFIDNLHQTFGFDEFFSVRKKYREFQYEAKQLNTVFKVLAKQHRMSLREIEQLFAKINLVIHATSENTYLHPALMAFLIVTKEFNKDVYLEYIKESSTPEKIISHLHKLIPENIRLKSTECAIVEAYLIAAKKDDYKSNIGSTIDNHVKIRDDDTSNQDQKYYSDKVIRIAEEPMKDYRSSIYLDGIIKRIEILENFKFNEIES